MLCGVPKKSPHISSIVQIIFSFWSFEISEGILRNQESMISLDAFLLTCLFVWLYFDLPVGIFTAKLKFTKLQLFSLVLCHQIYKVTD